MRRNCNLELRFLPPGSGFFSGDRHMVGESNESPQTQQQLTIFYNGRVVVCDVTETQARAILMLANRETMDERITTPTESEQASPTLSSQLCSSPSTALSMKKSLQRFLQKRKNRIQATSPYYH